MLIKRRHINETLYKQLPQEWPDVIRRVIARREIGSLEELDHSLAQLPSPDLLKDIKPAAERITQAIVEQQKILIIGDYDTDGATSTALAMRGLKMLGAQNLRYRIPNRFDCGYGFSPELLDQCLEPKPDLIVTVDNGICSVEGTRKANELGIDVVITDHHLPDMCEPDAVAVVNPNQNGCEFPCKHLAGVGVIFYVLLAVRANMREQGLFADKPEPNLADLLDLVALGTVADVMPLTQVNRILVSQGVARIRAGQCSEGIKALAQLSNRELDEFSTQDLGFAIAPRLNSAGRLHDMSVGVDCLMAEDFASALKHANQLDEYNQERREIEFSMKEEALGLVDCICAKHGQTPDVIAIYGTQWHQGIVGILAGRLKEQLNRPSIVFAEVEDEILRGSARSINGVNIRDIFSELAEEYPDLLLSHGGHAMAAGVSLYKSNFKQFKALLSERVGDLFQKGLPEAEWETDGEIQGHEFEIELARSLKDWMPWGQTFPMPIFDGVFLIEEVRNIKGTHVSIKGLTDTDHMPVDLIAFNTCYEQWMQVGSKVRVVYELNENKFRGQRKLQLLVRHIQPEEERH